MPSIRLEDLTPFGRAAVKLDRELSELAHAGGQISGVNIESDNGLDEAIKILSRVAEYGQSVADTMQEFSRSLQEARDKAEAATKLVAERAQHIQQRRQQQLHLQEKLTRVKEDITAIGASVAKPAQGEPSEEDRSRIAAELQRLRAPMAGFIEAAQAVKAEAVRFNFKRLERQADSVIDSLQASLRKLTQAIAPR
jgi:chromosome segregation ATPase